VQNQKTAFIINQGRKIFLEVVLSLIWIRFLSYLIHRWIVLKPDVRETIGIFLVLYCLLCLNLARGNSKQTQISLSLAIVVLGFAYKIVSMLA
jgi:hypothetical protein